jgi:rubredoxin---NAD+ reductase
MNPGTAPLRATAAAAIDACATAPWQEYICHACGYVYKELDGDPDGGLAAGTRFADIPEDWACPLCGVTKSDFELYAPPGLDALRARLSTTAPALKRQARQSPGVVIVGGGRAGWEVAEALRAHDQNLPITLVTACAGDVYDKPLLSVALARKTGPDKFIRETGVATAQRMQVQLLAHTHAIHIDPDTQQLRTTRGSLRYTHLVMAQGAQGVPSPTLPAHLCWRINHLAAYQKLRAALGNTPRKVVIAGAGLVGSELANDLALGGHHVTLLDVQDQPLARWAAQAAGHQLLEAWQTLPIQFIGQVKVANVEKTISGYSVTTACGQVLEADQVIAATGLQTPSRLALSAGLEWANGIAVDAQTLRTSNARIHALGDCISINGQTSRYIEPITRQARTIAADIVAAAPLPYELRPAVVRVKTSSLPLTLH